jgi:integrase
VIHAQAWASGPSSGGITLTFALGTGATARYGKLGNLDRVFLTHGRTLNGVPVGSGQGFQWSAGNGTSLLFANGDNNTKYHVTLDFTQTLLDKVGAVVPMSDCRKMYMVFAPRFENVEQDIQDGCFLTAGVGTSDTAWTVDDTSKLTGGRYFIGTPNLEERIQLLSVSEKAGPKTINDEVLLLLRLCGDQGDLIRAKLRREKAMKLPTPPSPGRAYTADEKARMLVEAAKLRSKNMYPALVVDLNCGLRDKELRELRWQQIDLVHKKQLTVGKSKTDAGTGRVIPLNDTVMIALEAHAAWYIRRFGECRPEWYVFAAGKGQPNDPTKPVTTLRTAWTKVRDKSKVVGRWHDNRHTLVTELAESGAGDEVIMSIAGHVSRAMLSRYSHVRMEAKRRALDEIAARQRAADEEHQKQGEQQNARRAAQAVVVQ